MLNYPQMVTQDWQWCVLPVQQGQEQHNPAENALSKKEKKKKATSVQFVTSTQFVSSAQASTANPQGHLSDHLKQFKS